MLEWVPIVLACTGTPLAGAPANCIEITVPLNEAQVAAFTGTTLEFCATYVADLGSDYATLAAKHGYYVVMSCIAVER